MVILIKISVSRYTRESGVRNLERKLAGICRAVAVRVAENAFQSKREKLDSQYADKKEMKNDKLSESVSHDATALAHPPEMPIVIDETAIEDILGVRCFFVFFSKSKADSSWTLFQSSNKPV